jgi:hypothetical protein
MYAAVGATVGLEALEAGARVVQHVRRGMDLERPGRLDLGIAPAPVAEIRDRHLVGEHGSEGGARGCGGGSGGTGLCVGVHLAIILE